jgi:hypothetical protein
LTTFNRHIPLPPISTLSKVFVHASSLLSC